MTGFVDYTPPDEHGVAHALIAHPGKLNALDTAMWLALREVFSVQVPRTAPRVVVVRGDAGTFVAGGDIAEFPDFRFEAHTLARFHEALVAPALQAMLDCDVPLIAHIEGACIGGGLEIAACCDIRLCGQTSRFGVPIAKLGFPMAPAEVAIVARVVGPTVLRELLLEARVLTAHEAFERGLITRVLPDDGLAAEVAQVASRMAQLSPQAMRLNKQVLREFGNGDAGTPASRAPHYAYAPSAEHREGLAAFNEKRPARF